jgi:Amt family ammonium transporter
MTPATISSGDTAWVLVCAALVLFMVPGLGLFYGGLVHRKNVVNTLLMTVAGAAIVTVQWVAFGYSFAFAPGSAVIGGLAWAGFSGVGVEPLAAYAPTIPHLAFAVFQAMFAAITVPLIAGAVIGRMRFAAFALFAVAWSTLVYDPLARWVWAEGGWLRAMGALDFAGGTVVHVSAGTAAVVLAWILGPRRERDAASGTPHNVPFTLLGAAMLWFGWFGFNAGSALGASGVAANAFVTTHCAAAAALVSWVVLDQMRTGKPTAVGAATGAVVGLVAITPAAGFVTPLAALAIGAIGAFVSHSAIRLRARTRLDDTLDVFACHGVAGIVGAVLTGVFATTSVNPAGADGLLAGNLRQVGVQVIAVAVAIGVSGIATAAIATAIRFVMPLRVSLPEERAGLDVTQHGEVAYGEGDEGELESDIMFEPGISGDTMRGISATKAA